MWQVVLYSVCTYVCVSVCAFRITLKDIYILDHEREPPAKVRTRRTYCTALELFVMFCLWWLDGELEEEQ